MKVSGLTGAQLNYWVAMAAGYESIDAIPKDVIGYEYHPHEPNGELRYEWEPSSNWAQGGPIIEREKNGFDFDGEAWNAWSERADVSDNRISGPTPLIAAMRAFVASKFGDEVPDEAPEAR